MTLAPGTKLGPYEILAPIGAGGMGEVWKARDTRLGRIVAIKKVKEQHSERFKQEARTIAALNHPYICQLFDIGPDYLVLEYVEGKPMSSPLPEREAVRLAIQIATALEAAHKKGIIHRDLKPGNIMVTDEGLVKLLDFGLAKLYERDASISTSPTADYPATQAGAVLGTVAYMSPEQAQGQPADTRSDIFSFGLVLYEMLSGRRAFSGDSNFAIMTAIVREEPALLQASPSLEQIVRRCLAKQPTARYQAISEIKTALEQFATEKVTVAATEPQPSIAVLPFINLSGDKEQEYFSDGLAEEIINALTQIPGLKVIARTSSFAFRGKEQDIRRIAEALSVTSILEGSVRRAGNKLRVTAQLINAADGSHLWSQRYDREMTDIFAIQDEISQAIVGRLRVRLAGDRPPVRRHAENVEAYSLYLEGKFHFLKPTAGGSSRCKEYFEQAIAMDPNWALPWFGLALFYWAPGYNGIMPPKTANAKCFEAVRRAMQLDEMLPEAHGAMAVGRSIEYDWKGAEQEFRKALELGPEVWDIWMQYSLWFLMPMQRLDEAVAALRRALEIDPLSPLLFCALGKVHFATRKYDKAIENCRHALELNPNYFPAYFTLSLAYSQTGRFDEGIRYCDMAAQHTGHSPIYAGYLGWAYAIAGRRSEAQRLLRELQELAQKTYMPATPFALIYSALGETDNALDWLEKAVDEREMHFMEFHVSSLFDPLRSHPRFQALLRKMNLEP